MLKQVSVMVKTDNVLQELAQKNSCKVTIVDCKHSNSNEMSLLVEIEGKDVNQLITDLKSRREVKRTYFAKSSSSKTLVMLILQSPIFCDVARSSNAFCVACPLNSRPVDGALEWSLLVKDAADMSNVIDLLRFRGATTNLRRIENAFRDEALTSHQKEILLEATRRGYFDFPRRVGLTALAKELSISPSTLSEILRRGESKIARAYASGLGLS